MMLTTYQGNPNIGLYAFATNKFCLVGRGFPKKLKDSFQKTLGVPVHEIGACGTMLTGVFFAGNADKVLVPEIMFSEELARLDELKIPYEIFHTDLTSLGNNLLVGPKGVIANPEFSDAEIRKISGMLGLPVFKKAIAGVNVAGSSATGNISGGVVHRDATPEDMSLLRECFGVEFEGCTVSLGNPFVKSGIICNDYDYIVSEQSGGPELQVIDNQLRRK